MKMRMRKRLTLGTAPEWTLLSTLQRMIPLLNPSLNSSSEGSAGKSFAPTTPTIFLSHPAASLLLDAINHQNKTTPSITRSHSFTITNTNLLFFSLIGCWENETRNKKRKGKTKNTGFLSFSRLEIKTSDATAVLLEHVLHHLRHRERQCPLRRRRHRTHQNLFRLAQTKLSSINYMIRYDLRRWRRSGGVVVGLFLWWWDMMLVVGGVCLRFLCYQFITHTARVTFSMTFCFLFLSFLFSPKVGAFTHCPFALYSLFPQSYSPEPVPPRASPASKSQTVFFFFFCLYPRLRWWHVYDTRHSE